MLGQEQPSQSQPAQAPWHPWLPPLLQPFAAGRRPSACWTCRHWLPSLDIRYLPCSLPIHAGCLLLPSHPSYTPGQSYCYISAYLPKSLLQSLLTQASYFSPSRPPLVYIHTTHLYTYLFVGDVAARTSQDTLPGTSFFWSHSTLSPAVPTCYIRRIPKVVPPYRVGVQAPPSYNYD